MSDNDKEEEDIIEYTKGTRMDDAYYFFKKPQEPVFEKGYPSYEAVNRKEKNDTT